MVQLQLFFRFLQFYWKAHTIYDVHSPFVATFCQKVLQDKRQFYAFSYIESLRNFLKTQDQSISVQDFGAGSQLALKQERSIKDVARYAASSPRLGKTLFLLVHWLKPKTMLELGTSLGISTLYLASPQSNARVVTIEGCPQTASFAQRHFRQMGISNIEQHIGPFDEVLPAILKETTPFDLVYIDGNHQKEASLRYLEWLIPHLTQDAVVIFGDIHWTEEMEAAWKTLKAHPKVTLSIDLFECGLLFFRQAQLEKAQFALVPKQWKPWRLGFFSPSPKS